MKKKLDQITCTRVKATEDEKNPNGNFSLRIQQTIMLFSFVITTRFSYLDCMMFVVRLKMWYFKKNPWSEMLRKKKCSRLEMWRIYELYTLNEIFYKCAVAFFSRIHAYEWKILLKMNAHFFISSMQSALFN